MKKPHHIYLLCFQLFVYGLQAKETKLDEPLNSLSEEIIKLFPEGSILQVSGSKGFSIQHETQEFMVHNINMIGQISKNAHKATGPSYKGAIFRINILDQDAAIQAVTPQTLRKPYWSSYINHLKFDGYSLFYSFEYGTRTDKKLFNSVTQKVNILPDQIQKRR